MSDVSARRVFLLALVTAGALSAWKPLREPDLFWHLALGRAVWRARSRTVVEPLAHLDLGRTREVPEWLWDVAQWGLWNVGGALATTLALSALGALIGALLWRVLRAHDRAKPLAPAVLCAALALTGVLSRVRERPETLVCALLLASLALLGRLGEPGARRGAISAALVAIGLLWAQVHSTSPLLLAVVGLALAPDLRAMIVRKRVDGVSLALLGGVALAPLSGAHGVGVLAALRAHAAGDAVLHVADMHPPVWATFNPAENVMGPAWFALLALGLGGMARAGVCWPRRVGYALLGAAMAATAVRGLAFATVLALPLARAGAEVLWTTYATRRPRLALTLVGACAALVSVRGAMIFAQRQGPVGVIGVREFAQPFGTLGVLRALPRGSHVYAPPDIAASLGYALDGHARTFVDTRTPMHFDDAQYAVARDIARAWSPGAALERYDTRAVVTARESPLCTSLRASPRWRPVALAGPWSVFVRDDTAPALGALVALDPCGSQWVRGACGAEVARENAAQRALLPAGVWPLVDAEVSLRCGGVLDSVAYAETGESYAPGAVSTWLRSLRVRMAVRMGRPDDAVEPARSLAAEGHTATLAALVPALHDAAHRRVLREILATAAEALDDATPPDLRATLAIVCAEEGDRACARFHALRAAAQGNPQVLPALRWLRRRARDANEREDYERWEGALSPTGVVETLRAPPPGGGI